jgi:hypothetical protein
VTPSPSIRRCIYRWMDGDGDDGLRRVVGILNDQGTSGGVTRFALSVPRLSGSFFNKWAQATHIFGTKNLHPRSWRHCCFAAGAASRERGNSIVVVYTHSALWTRLNPRFYLENHTNQLVVPRARSQCNVNINGLPRASRALVRSIDVHKPPSHSDTIRQLANEMRCE